MKRTKPAPVPARPPARSAAPARAAAPSKPVARPAVVRRSAAASRPVAQAAAAPVPASSAEVEQLLYSIEPGWAKVSKAPERPAERPVVSLLGDLASKDAAARAAAAQALGSCRDVQAIAPLRAALSDGDKVVRRTAAMALLRLGDPALLAETIKGLEDPMPRSAAGAALALGLSGNRAAVPKLIAAFRTHDAGLGAAVCRALGLLADPQALDPLLTALKAGFVAADVCRALGRIGDAKALPALTRALRHPDDKVRAEAARAIGLVEQPPPEPTLKALHKLFDDKSPRVRLSAALALYEHGDRDAGRRLLEVLGAAREKAARRRLTAEKAGS